MTRSGTGGPVHAKAPSPRRGRRKQSRMVPPNRPQGMTLPPVSHHEAHSLPLEDAPWRAIALATAGLPRHSFSDGGKATKKASNYGPSGHTLFAFSSRSSRSSWFPLCRDRILGATSAIRSVRRAAPKDNSHRQQATGHRPLDTGNRLPAACRSLSPHRVSHTMPFCHSSPVLSEVEGPVLSSPVPSVPRGRRIPHSFRHGGFRLRLNIPSATADVRSAPTFIVHHSSFIIHKPSPPILTRIDAHFRPLFPGFSNRKFFPTKEITFFIFSRRARPFCGGIVPQRMLRAEP